MFIKIYRRFIIFILIVTIPFVGLSIYLNISEKKQLTDLKTDQIKSISNQISTEYQNVTDSTKHLLIAISQNNSVLNNSKLCSAYFNNLINQYRRYYNIGLADSRGNIICSAVPISNISQLAVFKNTQKTENFSVGDYRLNDLDQPIISFGYPFGNNVVFASLYLSWLDQFSNSFDNQNQLVVTLTDRNGTILSRNPNNQHWIGQQLPFDQIIDNVDNSSSKIAISNGIDHISRYYTYARLGSTNESLFAFIGFPQSTITNTTDPIFYQRIFLTLLVLIISLVFSWFLGNKLIIEQVSALSKVDQLKNDFISLASHQIRTPLTSIKWHLELLLLPQTGRLNQKQKSMINLINLSAQKITSLINTLLDISKIENSGYKIQLSNIDFVSIVKSVIFDQSNEISTKKLTIKVHSSPKLPSVPADSKIITQAVVNLVSNAIKYSYPDTIIYIKLLVLNNTFQFSISNRGDPISSSEQPFLFQKFFRTSSSVLSNPEGSGLGLYLAKIIVESHHGQIWLTSSSSRTTFYFTLPLVS